jgi:hypothetical protein
VLYGVTPYGGAGDGTVFVLEPPAVSGGAWSMKVLHSFSGGDGVGPGGLTAGGSVLYGVTTSGGVYNHGTVFALKE